MKTLIAKGKVPVARHYSPDNKKLTIKDKLLLGLSLSWRLRYTDQVYFRAGLCNAQFL
jgi:hypothetical protein